MAQKRANIGVCFATFETIVAFVVIRDVVSLPKSSARAPASDVHAALRNDLGDQSVRASRSAKCRPGVLESRPGRRRPAVKMLPLFGMGATVALVKGSAST